MEDTNFSSSGLLVGGRLVVANQRSSTVVAHNLLLMKNALKDLPQAKLLNLVLGRFLILRVVNA